MTISVTTPLDTYTGNAATTAFTYNFKILEETDISVYLDSVLQTLNSDYTVTGEGNNNGGTVTFSVAPGSGVEVRLERITTLARATDYADGAALPSATLNDELDKLHAMVQELDRRAFQESTGASTLNADSRRIVNVSDPVDGNDACNLSYATALLSGASAGIITGDFEIRGNTTLGDAIGDSVTIDAGTMTLPNGVTVSGTWTNLGTVTTADINGGTIDGATIGGSSAGAGTFTALTATGAFTSLGIDDNAASTALTIDSSGQVSINGTAANTKLQVTGTSGQYTAKLVGNSTASSSWGLFIQAGTNSSDAALVVRDYANTTMLTCRGDKVIELNAGQLKFPASQAASSDANTLDDYEEGTFTPAIEGSTTAGTGTYSTQLGRYRKLGSLVHFSLAVQITAHTGTGNIWITGLPFTVNSTQSESGCIGFVENLALTAGNYVKAYITASASRVILLQVPTGGGAVTSVPMDTAFTIYVSGCYTTD